MHSGVSLLSRQDSHRHGKAWRERLLVVVSIGVLHATVFAAGWLRAGPPAVHLDEMAISFAPVQGERAPPQVQPQPKRTAAAPLDELGEVAAKPLPPQPQAEMPPAPQPEEIKPVVQAAPSAPAVLDAEPDYHAAYLNNPRPSYPPAARRLGLRGRVVLKVEVLADGRAGQVLLHTSSGYGILDNAALQTVKTWRFTPARRLGQAVTDWSRVPVDFSFEDENA